MTRPWQAKRTAHRRASPRRETCICSPRPRSTPQLAMAQLRLTSDVPLAPRTTFELGGAARFLIEVGSEDALIDALRWGQARAVPVFLLGGGSNVVVSDRGFDGLVVVLALRGVTLRDECGRVSLRASAGEPWDELVARAVEADLAGIECLSGIPGLAGATPVQNVGAYGQEVADTIASVRTVDRKTLDVRTRAAVACGFGYRRSRFQVGAGRDEVVTEVTYALSPNGAPCLRYPELARAVRESGGDAPGLRAVRDAVVSLRRSKSMVLDAGDPNRRSAGSFFVNPIVAREVADEIAARACEAGVIARSNELPRFDVVERGGGARDLVKLSAGWLIERAGFPKGTRAGAVGVSSRHALALVHHGGGTARELVAFACRVRDAVDARFGVRLRPEPVIVGDDLEALLGARAGEEA